MEWSDVEKEMRSGLEWTSVGWSGMQIVQQKLSFSKILWLMLVVATGPAPEIRFSEIQGGRQELLRF